VSGNGKKSPANEKKRAVRRKGEVQGEILGGGGSDEQGKAAGQNRK